MNSNIILIVLGEPNSTFLEVLFKYFISSNFKKNNKRVVLIGNKRLFYKQMEYLKYKININEIHDLKYAKKNFINLINVDYNFKKIFSKISSSSNKYIENCFNLAIKLIASNKLSKLMNGPISKSHFLKKRYLRQLLQQHNLYNPALVNLNNLLPQQNA